MILTYIFGAILVLIAGWIAYVSYKDEVYPITALMIFSVVFIVSISAYDIFIKKEIKNRIEMKVVVPKNSVLNVNFVNENGDSISNHRVQYID